MKSPIKFNYFHHKKIQVKNKFIKRNKSGKNEIKEGKFSRRKFRQMDIMLGLTSGLLSGDRHLAWALSRIIHQLEFINFLR